MELGGEPRVGLVADALVGAVVHIDEIWLPVRGKRLRIHRISMVLRRDKATGGPDLLHGLVVAAVSVFEFVDSGSRRLAEPLYEYAVEQLIAQGVTVKKGVFGADMKIEQYNDGPVTILLET